MKSKTKIAIYGLSQETEKYIPELSRDYEIVGLLDGFKTDGMMYNYPIISIEKAMAQEIEKIIVIARPGSCKAITKRIGDFCEEHRIELWDIRGKNLLEAQNVSFDFGHVQGYKKSEVVEKIRMADAVSFDLFDTLVIRNTLYSTDVIELTLVKLNEQGIVIPDFVLTRLAIEKELSQKTAPTLEEIYEVLLKQVGMEAAYKAEHIAAVEYETDLVLIEARRESVELIQEVKRYGKKVYITTDTYYSKKQIENLLRVNNIVDYDEILVSSEYKKGKTQGLFSELIQTIGTDNILHIGDDVVSDIQAAESCGLKSFRLYSGLELLDLVGGFGLYECANALFDRVRVGMFVTSIFNSPFQFEESKKTINVKSSFDVGYLFFAPMIVEFVLWFKEQVKQNGCNNIWFGARDGYLVQKIYDMFYPEENTEYVLTSRIASVRAGIKSEDDILYIDKMQYSGSKEDKLRTRFGVDTIDFERQKSESKEFDILKYSDLILANAEIKRKNYKKYLDKIEVNNGNIAFFDFVAKGTCQSCLQRIVNNPMIGFYFLQLEPEHVMDDISIVPFYTEEEKENSSIFEDYYILETVLTSMEPSIIDFSDQGYPIYANETRSKKELMCIQEVQKGVISYAEKYKNFGLESTTEDTKRLSERFLSLVHNFGLQSCGFLDLVVEDVFFNRMTKITDVI